MLYNNHKQFLWLITFLFVKAQRFSQARSLQNAKLLLSLPCSKGKESRPKCIPFCPRAGKNRRFVLELIWVMRGNGGEDWGRSLEIGEEANQYSQFQSTPTITTRSCTRFISYPQNGDYRLLDY